jgi:AraC-like DNA-binding protein
MIRQAFAERVRSSAVLQSVLNDLRQVSGLRVQFLDVTRTADFQAPCCTHSPMCQRLDGSDVGRALCVSSCLRLLDQAREGTAKGHCVAGTVVCAVPIRASVGLLGYLVVAGFYEARPLMRETNRVRHLLERDGVRLEREEIARLCGRTTVIPPPRVEAMRRMLEMAAGYLVKELSLELFQAGEDLPASIKRACQLIREQFREDPSQEEIARGVGLSTSHFSRLFHRRTGLRFKEYVNELRLQQTRQDLRESEEPITSIAFAAGYRSISQFNRQFKGHYGLSPREYRRRHRRAARLDDGQKR